MKKLFLSILVICSLLGGNAYAERNLENVFLTGISKKEMCKLTRNKKALTGTVLPGAAYCHKAFQSKFIYFDNYKTEIIPPMEYYNVNIPHPQIYFIFENVKNPMRCTFNTRCKYGDGNLKAIAYSKEVAIAIANPSNSDEDIKKLKANMKLKKEKEIQIKTEKNKRAVAQASGDLSFTIKDKKEQCEVIGFKPETEKFADCVLRLVELDVKKQQSNKIASAQNSGNEALVKQLQRQQYDRGTDALLNLGQQLLYPRTTNSNIYMPQTQRCTLQGFGTFAKMVCR